VEAQRHFAELYRRFGPVVYRRCVRLLGDRDQARDATQEVFVKLLRQPDRFADAEAAVPWAMTVATNHCLHVLRDSKRRSARHEEIAREQDAVVASPEQAHARRRLAGEALGGADPLTRQIVAGVVMQEREQQEVATELGVSSRTVTRRLHRFLDAARKLLHKEEAPR
jgi:RNA polymerase sigma-70 factor (ECF subfamily)